MRKKRPFASPFLTLVLLVLTGFALNVFSLHLMEW